MASFTPTQVTAVYDALGLHHDYTLGVVLTPGRIHVTTALLDEAGSPVVTGGVLQRVESSYQVEDPPAEETPVEEPPSEETPDASPEPEPMPEEVPA